MVPDLYYEFSKSGDSILTLLKNGAKSSTSNLTLMTVLLILYLNDSSYKAGKVNGSQTH